MGEIIDPWASLCAPRLLNLPSPFCCLELHAQRVHPSCERCPTPAGLILLLAAAPSANAGGDQDTEERRAPERFAIPAPAASPSAPFTHPTMRTSGEEESVSLHSASTAVGGTDRS